MRRYRRERLVNAALWLSLAVLLLCLVLARLTAPRTEPVEESRPFYSCHIIGGIEEDTAHIIEKSIPEGG